MLISLAALLVTLHSIIRSRLDLQLENLALRGPNRRASPLGEEAAEVKLEGSPLLGLPVPPLARLAFDVGHRQARNGRGLASQGLSPILDLEGPARTTRTPRHCPRDPRSDPEDVPGESRLGCTPHSWRAAQTRYRHRRDQRQ